MSDHGIVLWFGIYSVVLELMSLFLSTAEALWWQTELIVGGGYMGGWLMLFHIMIS